MCLGLHNIHFTAQIGLAAGLVCGGEARRAAKSFYAFPGLLSLQFVQSCAQRGHQLHQGSDQFSHADAVHVS